MWNCGPSVQTSLPAPSVRTLILNNVAALSVEEQQELSDWLDRERPNIQIVTTSPVPIFPLVRSGVFLDTLYYRLNVIYAEIAAP